MYAIVLERKQLASYQDKQILVMGNKSVHLRRLKSKRLVTQRTASLEQKADSTNIYSRCISVGYKQIKADSME